MNTDLKSVAGYISSFPVEVQMILQKIREIIHEKAPGASESMAYGMPAYKTGGKPLVYFAAFKNHIGFYATPTGHSAFADELKGYKQGKGSVQFPLNKPIPYDLVGRIVAFRVEENKLKKQAMKGHLEAKFVVERENKKIKVEKKLDAPIKKVWAAWTDSQLMDQWWAPKPWRTKTKTMDFREGGSWLYAMVGPEGEEHWCRADFHTIVPGKSFQGYDAFCDPEGTFNTDLPGSHWKVELSEKESYCLAEIELAFEKVEDLDKNLEMGFKEGFLMALGNLDELLGK